MKYPSKTKPCTGVTGIVRFLLVLIAAAFIFSLSACKGKNPPAPDDTSGTDSSSGKPPAAVDELQQVVDGIEEQNLDYTFRIITSNWVNDVLQIIQAPTDENEGDVINDALVRRDRIIEDKLGIGIEYILKGTDPYELTSSSRTAISTNLNEFDVIIGDMYNVAQTLCKNQLLLSFNEIPNIDLSKPWWSKSATEDLTINGKLYFATGDITPRYVLSPYIMQFNKRLLDENQIEYPYSLVKSGTWTVEALVSMIENKFEERSDNMSRDEADFFGLACDVTASYAFFRGCDVKLVNLDPSGKPVLNTDTVTLDKITSFLGKALGDNRNVFIGEASYQEQKIFNSGRALFVGNTLTNIQMYNKMTDAYGILPMPKYAETQQSYCSYGQPWGAVSVLMPITNTNTELTGTVLEAMASVSKYTSTLEALDRTLKLRRSSDSESGEMLDVIFSSLSYDLGTIFRWGGIYTALIDSVRLNEVFLTKYESISGPASSQIAALLKNPAFADAQGQ